MADTFEGLGLRAELVTAAGEADYRMPTALQRAVIPVVRRGGNAVVQGSAGAGVVGAYGLAVLDRLAEAAGGGGGPRALVLAPTEEVASWTAESLARFARPAGIRVGALAAGWALPRSAADVVVATAEAALAAVNASELKVEGVQALVVDGADAILTLGAGEALETLTDSLPRDAQRVVVAGEISAELDDYIERHVRRALRLPPRAAEQPAAPGASVAYSTAAPAGRLGALVRLLEGAAAGRERVVFCGKGRQAAELADALALRGFAVGMEGGVQIAAPEAGGRDFPEAFAISYQVPQDAATLADRHAGGGAVLVAPRELPHLRRIAAEAGFVLRPEDRVAARGAYGDVAAYRERLRRAVEEEDLAAQLELLAPLFDEYSPAEIAAAASALLRRRATEAPPAAAAQPAAPAAPRAWVRLFISVGQRENLRPGDLVGVITGEAGIRGEEVGRIDIRDSFSVVEVAAPVAEKVIRALNGTTLKGRSVRVDYDRRGAAGPPRRGRPGS